MQTLQPIGVFDSGYGGLTVLKEIVKKLPAYDYCYLGDNARAPYGPRSFDTVYRYTLQCVEWFFERGCPLVILACNTASAKALRNIQQKILPVKYPGKKVLGVIRPTAEVIGRYSKGGKLGILATTGTVVSQSYPIEIKKFFPQMEVYQQACPMWVPMVENNEQDSEEAGYFIRKDINKLFAQAPGIDTVLLACTHYPLLQPKIEAAVPAGVTILSQGTIIADSLADYLQRHPEIAGNLTRFGQQQFFTTDDTADFDEHAGAFFGKAIHSTHITLDDRAAQ